MDTPTEALYNLRVEMFEMEGGEKLYQFWNPGTSHEEYEYERNRWITEKKATENSLDDFLIGDFVMALNKKSYRRRVEPDEFGLPGAKE